MRIHLPLQPHRFLPVPPSSPSQPPIIQLGGSLVILELQGSLSHEGEKSNGVVGILGLDRPDKPTLHLGEHHLLHGKIVNLGRPYAVIRKVVGVAGREEMGREEQDGEQDEDGVDEDEDEEEEEDVEVKTPKRVKADKGKGKVKSRQVDVNGEEEDEPPLFAPNPDVFFGSQRSSSPFYPSSAMGDYSSELDIGSPGRGGETDEDEDGDEAEEKEARLEAERLRGEQKRRDEAKRKRKERRIKEGKGRVRHYEVVGIVRKKVVFALRPEPIVTATILPD